MKSPRRTFLAGLLVGTGITIALALAIAVAALYLGKPVLVERVAANLKPPPVPTTALADFDWRLTSLEGTSRHVSEFQGQTLLLQFWEPGCLPCLAEIGALNALQDALPERAVQILAVSLGSDTETRQAVAQYQIRYPVYLLDGPRPAVFQDERAPATYIINARGEIVLSHFAAARWNDPSVVTFLTQLAAPHPGAP